MPSATRLWAWANRPTAIWKMVSTTLMAMLTQVARWAWQRPIGVRAPRKRRRKLRKTHDLRPRGRRYYSQARHFSRMSAMGKLSETLALAQERARSLNLAYAGALTPREAWDVLQLAPAPSSWTMRTRAEWDWVGRVPGAVEIEWMLYPGNEPNAHFLAQFKRQVDPEALVMFLCRSGARSNSAANLAAASGYTNAYNILEGFEGDKGRQRAPQQGRRLAPRHLPWIQG